MGSLYGNSMGVENQTSVEQLSKEPKPYEVVAFNDNKNNLATVEAREKQNPVNSAVNLGTVVRVGTGELNSGQITVVNTAEFSLQQGGGSASAGVINIYNLTTESKGIRVTGNLRYNVPVNPEDNLVGSLSVGAQVSNTGKYRTDLGARVTKNGSGAEVRVATGDLVPGGREFQVFGIANLEGGGNVSGGVIADGNGTRPFAAANFNLNGSNAGLTFRAEGGERGHVQGGVTIKI